MKIRFQSLQDSLRSSIWARLERGELTGKRLATAARFRQAHLSNFLNARRGLSLQAMDRLLDVLRLDILDLAGVNEAGRQAQGAADDNPVQPVAVVSLEVAARVSRFDAHFIQDTVSFRQSFLRRLKPKMVGNRRDWTRFAVVMVDEDNAASMAPLLNPGALVLIDRHNNTPPPGGKPWDPSLFAVTDGSRSLIRRVTVAQGNLILRPSTEAPDSSVQLIPVPVGRRHGDFIIGRVCHVSMEL